MKAARFYGGKDIRGFVAAAYTVTMQKQRAHGLPEVVGMNLLDR